MTDPIADMLTRIRNALIVKHDTVEIPASNMKNQSLKYFSKKATLRLTNSSKTAFRAR